MKLYTEEQVRIAIDKARDYYDGFVFTEEEVIEKLTPIELPSDEKIIENLLVHLTELRLILLQVQYG